MIDFHELNNVIQDSDNQTAYERFRYDLIRRTEGVKQAVYLDSKNIPTIGIGFNLTDENIRNLILGVFEVTDPAAIEDIKNIITNHTTNKTDPTTDLNAKMAVLAAHKPKLANRSIFAFSDEQAGIDEMRSVFDEAVLLYDNSDTNIGPLGRVDN